MPYKLMVDGQLHPSASVGIPFQKKAGLHNKEAKMKKINNDTLNALLGILTTVLRLFIGLLIVSGVLYAVAGLYYSITYLLF